MKILELIIKILTTIWTNLKGIEQPKPIEEEQVKPIENIPITPPIEVIEPIKLGKDALSFFNADKTKIKRVIDTYKHFRTTYEGITIHNNGNPSSTARQDVDWALNQLPQVSWHYSVDDKEVVRFLAHPDYWGYSCWASGDGNKGFGNSKTINIEICEFNGYNNPNDPRWLKSRQNAIHLIAQLLKDHNWGIDRIGTHKDRSGKNCPRVILKELDKFKQEVNEVLQKLK